MVLNSYLKLFISVLLAVTCNVAVVAAINLDKQTDSAKTVFKLKDNRNNRPIFNKINTSFETFMLKISAIKNPNDNNKTIGLNPIDNQKPIDNVKIFPNPVSTQVNISFSLKKENKVSIKILDVLGNEIITLLDQKLPQGEQSNTFTINAKIPTGFYFIRIVSGNESVIKRISVI